LGYTTEEMFLNPGMERVPNGYELVVVVEVLVDIRLSKY